MKKILTFTLVIFIILNTFISCAYLDKMPSSKGVRDDESGLDFYLLSDDTYGVMAGDAIYDERVSIPSEFKGKAVTQILHNAFEDCQALKEIVIPESVTTIGDYAFHNCTYLEISEIPAGVTYIGNYAFQGCNSITELVFSSNSLALGKSSFSMCVNLTSIDFGNGLNNVGYGAFSYCDGLTEIEIGGAVESIEPYAFYGCANLTDVTVSDSVVSICDRAFYNCTSLTNVHLGKGLQTIDAYAFHSCPELVSINIPVGVSYIGDRAFYNCNSLSSITVDEENSTYRSIDGSLYSKDGSMLVRYAVGKNEMRFVLPETVTQIGSCAFEDCNNLVNIELGANLLSIGDYAFYNSNGFSDITLPYALESIGYNAFASCGYLGYVRFENSDEWIAKYSPDAEDGRDFDSDEISDASSAADYLGNLYCEFYWERGPHESTFEEFEEDVDW